MEYVIPKISLHTIRSWARTKDVSTGFQVFRDIVLCVRCHVSKCVLEQASRMWNIGSDFETKKSNVRKFMLDQAKEARKTCQEGVYDATYIAHMRHGP